MAASKQASPAMIAIAVVVAILIIGGLWWKLMGPRPSGSSTAATEGDVAPGPAAYGTGPRGAGAPGAPGPGTAAPGVPGGR